VPRLKFITLCGAILSLNSTYPGSFIFDSHRKFLFLDFASRKRNIFSFYQHCESSIINDILLSFQLKCSSNIDSIHYLRLTNSFHQVPRNIHTLPVKEPIPSI
jgi:hypothetical protein